MARGGIFSAHIGYLVNELPFAQGFTAAAAAGFDAVKHPGRRGPGSGNIDFGGLLPA